jgi:hypothetical protein
MKNLAIYLSVLVALILSLSGCNLSPVESNTAATSKFLQTGKVYQGYVPGLGGGPKFKVLEIESDGWIKVMGLNDGLGTYLLNTKTLLCIVEQN